MYYNEEEKIPLNGRLILLLFLIGGENMLESGFKTKLIKDIKSRLEGSEVFHLNPLEKQGVPDLLILYKSRWGVLEGKKEKKSSHRPNQDYYVDKYNQMSFARFISPENKEEVLDELEQAFRT